MKDTVWTSPVRRVFQNSLERLLLSPTAHLFSLAVKSQFHRAPQPLVVPFNSTMDVETLHVVLQQSFSPDGNLRIPSEETIRNLKHIKGATTLLLQVAAEKKVSVRGERTPKYTILQCRRQHECRPRNS